MVGPIETGAKNETYKTGQASESGSPFCGCLRFHLVYDYRILVDRKRFMYRDNDRVPSGWAMTYGCGADGCLTCYPYQYACADCGARWEKPINNGEKYECTECEYINNSREEL